MEGEHLSKLTDTNGNELQEKLGARDLEVGSSALTSWWRPAPRAWIPGGARRGRMNESATTAVTSCRTFDKTMGSIC